MTDHPLLTFYCSHCRSDRVVGQTFVPLNFKTAPNGDEYPTVSDAEVKALSATAARVEHYKYYCADCKQFGNQLLDDQSLAESRATTLN